MPAFVFFALAPPPLGVEEAAEEEAAAESMAPSPGCCCCCCLSGPVDMGRRPASGKGGGREEGAHGSPAVIDGSRATLAFSLSERTGAWAAGAEWALIPPFQPSPSNYCTQGPLAPRSVGPLALLLTLQKLSPPRRCALFPLPTQPANHPSGPNQPALGAILPAI